MRTESLIETTDSGLPPPLLKPSGPVPEFMNLLHSPPLMVGGPLQLPFEARRSFGPAVAAIRWGTLMIGMVFAAPEAAKGKLDVVVAMGLLVFNTTYRTMRPLALGSKKPIHIALLSFELLIASIAATLSGQWNSPFAFSLLPGMLVAGFGLGYAGALGASAMASAVVTVGALTARASSASAGSTSRLILLWVVTAFVAAFARNRLIEAEINRQDVAGRVEKLEDANDLLFLLNQLARTVPEALDLHEALESTKGKLKELFDPSSLAVLVYDDVADTWSAELVEGCRFSPIVPTSRLPSPLLNAIDTKASVRLGDLDATNRTGMNSTSGSGMYSALRARGQMVGLVAVEHPNPDHFTDRHINLLNGLTEVLALTIDNARWFRRLRSVGAEEERVRIARDLHDRLGQWLTYISFELERIISGGPLNDDLSRLHGDVVSAITELRETLVQLRSTVTEGNPFESVAVTLIDRFERRNGTTATFTITHPGQRAPARAEHEVFRILQESLNNIEKHAKAGHVDIIWSVNGENARLTISDNGRGFDMAGATRLDAYGLLGMRERANAVGAKLEMQSAPGQGTTVVVEVSTKETK